MVIEQTEVRMLTAATLFSGIGAPEVAMPEWHWPWHAEIEKFPSAVMAARHPQSINLGDVSADGFAERAGCIATPDVIVFGSPCQSYSIAGKRLGLDDPRGNLALVALGIIDRLKPDWFVFENVPGLLSSSEGSDFGIFLRTVDELGYFGAWASLDAQWFGVAQRRERLFFVGHSGDWRYPAAVLFEPESLCGNHPPRRETGKTVTPTIAAHTKGGGGLGADFDCDGGLIAFGGNNTSGEIDVSTAVNAHGGSGRMDFESETFIAFSCKDHGADAMYNCAPTLRAGTHNKSHANAGVPPAVTVASQGGGDKPRVLTSAVRRLTPRECESLQGFPQDYSLITYRNKPSADGPRYKAIGNSMAVPVIRWILNRIEKLNNNPR